MFINRKETIAFLLLSTNFRTMPKIDGSSRSVAKKYKLFSQSQFILFSSHAMQCGAMLWKDIFCFMVFVAGVEGTHQPPPNPANHDDLFSTARDDSQF